jgi:methionine synthase II (cobalamin-independent)
MRLICIDNYSLEIGTTAPITPGKIYESIESFSSKDYFITNDSGFKSWEQKENFITLEEFREQQLNDLGI